MYRQVWVRQEDRRFQRILWRPNRNEPIRANELNTVTYGTTAASFLATRALTKIGEEHEALFPLASRVIRQDFYVDDLLTGCETVNEAIELRRELTRILEKAGFDLRKWASNEASVLADSNEDRGSVPIQIPDKDSKTLEVLWEVDSDELLYSVKNHTANRVTKRIILSEIAQIFDPLGPLGPVITRAKLIMQGLWQQQLGWDESLPQEMHSSVLEFRSELSFLSSLKIPRRAVCEDRKILEMHGFSDASENAYGACIYLRTHNNKGDWGVRLLCAKSRVAPLKVVSLPRLELCGAVLLSQLATKARQALQLHIGSEHYWTDSTIVLAWIKDEPGKWKHSWLIQRRRFKN